MSFDPAIRPRDHFTPRRGWLNDPNGLIVHDGEFHLFFQHAPDSIVWGPMSWGHAVSSDLLDWTELPVALASSEVEHMWSGSVVHDSGNTSGLGTTATGPLVAAYTSVDPATGVQAQSLASSDDRGRTWRPHAGNPVIDIGSTSFRDPKVVRHGDGWLMVLVLADDRRVETYRSPDLLHWERVAGFGPAGSVEGMWECPDLVRVPVEDTDDVAHVMLLSVQSGAPAGGSGMQYFVGEMEGESFRATQEAQWLDHGADFYAAVSYADADGPEPLVQGWMSNWLYADRVPATDFRGSMTLARRLALRRRDGRLVLVQRPVVRDDEQVHAARDRAVTGTLALPVSARTCRVVAEVEARTASRVGLQVRVGPEERTTVWVDPRTGTVALDRTASGSDDVHPAFAAVHTAPRLSTATTVRLEVVVDVASVEVFVDGGEVVLTDQVFPDPASTGIAVVAEGGEAYVHHLTVHA